MIQAEDKVIETTRKNRQIERLSWWRGTKGDNPQHKQYAIALIKNKQLWFEPKTPNK